MKAYIVSLGCPKNLTDSEVLMGQLSDAGYEITLDPSAADIIIVNTCAFLKSARDESLGVIKEMSIWKKKGRCKKLYVAGCLPKYYKSIKNPARPSQVDGFIDSTGLFDCRVPRIKATNPWFAYVKIAEGCNNRCSYCLIPAIRGGFKTRGSDDILKEAKNLANRGVKEIIYVAQDTSAYPGFANLLKKTAKIKGIEWIRIMYAHPKHLTNDVINAIAQEKKIVKYLDMPIQHASNKILDLMNRKYTLKDVEGLISRARKKVPKIAIRTSFIVGFPNETNKDFKELVSFVKAVKFDRLGVFPYSRESQTKAGRMKAQISEKIKQERVDKLMRLQAGISKEKNKNLVGNTIYTIVEKENKSHYIGRSYRDAPEIDGSVSIKKTKNLRLGSIVPVRIKKATSYDLAGHLAGL
jgi:ribosomal protein S12 methylthiotransferase